MSEQDKLTGRAAGYVMRFIRNDSDRLHEDEVVVETVERTDEEIELAFTLERDRYYLRIRTSDLRRLIKAAP